MIRSSAAILIALVLLGVLAVPVRADATPDSGTITSTATVSPTGTFNVFDVNSTGSGVDLLSGDFTTTTTYTLTFTGLTTDIFSGSFVDVFSGGKTFGTFTGSGSLGAFTNVTVITGGTGIFAGDTGEFTVIGTSTEPSRTTISSTSSYKGFIKTPEPSSLALILAGIGLPLVMRKRIGLAVQ
jgi:hypothetical protein